MSSDPSDHGTRAEEEAADLEALVAECLERIEQEGAGALEEMCGRHPLQAAAIKKIVGSLAGVGLTPQAKTGNVPQALGDFRMLRELGRGGMGIVFEAEQVSLARKVALKVLFPHFTADERAVTRFQREGAAAAKLLHKGIVQVYAIGAERGVHFIAMELVEGAPLDRVLARTRSQEPGALSGETVGAAVRAELEPVAPAPVHHAGDARDIEEVWSKSYVETVVGLVAQVADALEHAHRSGVVHRDVKPSNIMVRADGTAVLTDFGLAWQEGLPGLTLTGVFAGTPFYTSPEQAASKHLPIDHRADVFSLGATLYELLTLRRPFTGERSSEVLQSILHQEPRDPRKLNPLLAQDLAAIVLKALEKEPARRYQSAALFAADLRAFLDYRPVQARHAGTATRVRRWCKREPLKAALVALLVAGVPVIAALAGYLIANRPMILLAEREEQRRHVEEALLRGYLQLGDRRLAEALATFQHALDAAPHDIELVAGLARALTALQRSDEAFAMLDREGANAAEPTSLQWVRAACLQLSGQEDRALALEKELGEPHNIVDLSMASVAIAARGLESNDAGAFRKAQGWIEQAIMLAPRPRPYLFYALAMAVHYTDDAETGARAAVALASHGSGRGTQQAIGLALEGADPKAAVAAYERALAEEPDSAAVRINMSNALERLGERKRALDLLHGIPARDPQYGSVLYSIARLEFYDDDLDAAERDYRAAIALEPDNVAAIMGLANVLGHRDDTDGQIALLAPAAQRHPQVARLQNNLADALIEKGRAAQALPHLEQAIAADPDYDYAHFTKAHALVVLDRLPEAQATLQNAIDSKPRSAERWKQLATFLLEDRTATRDVEGAIRAARRAVDCSEGKAIMPRWVLSQALYLAERFDEAASEMRALRPMLEQSRQSGAKKILQVLDTALQRCAERATKKSSQAEPAAKHAGKQGDTRANEQAGTRQNEQAGTRPDKQADRQAGTRPDKRER